MAQFLQVLLSGLSTGAIYALVAIGFTLVWQAARTVNFAQGEFVMLPAFFVLIGAHWLHMPLWLALVFGLIMAVIVLGLLFKKVVVEPMLPNGGLPLIIATMALSILLKEGAKQFYSAEAQPFPSLFPRTTLNFDGAVVSVQDLMNLIVSLAVVVGLTLFLNRTRTGRCMQATAQNPGVAEILGVNTKRMVLYAFLVNAALGGAGVLPDLADLSRQVLQRRDPWARRLHRRHRRRLQPDPRRARGRASDRGAGQPHSHLRDDGISRGVAAGAC